MDDVKNNIVESAYAVTESLMKMEQIKDDGDKTHFLVPKGKEVFVVENNKDRPTRKKGNKNFTSAKSFCSYVNKHKSEDETIIIADEDKSLVKAIINDNGAETAAWSDFTAKLNIEHSTQWKEWFNNSHERRNGLFDQTEFAEFVEKNRSDFICGKFELGGKEVDNIAPNELNSMIRNLKITVSEKISSKIDKQGGAVNFSYENEEDGKGEFNLPDQIYIIIPVYRSADLFKITIRLMYRNNSGAVKFFYIIDNIDNLKSKAFDKICHRIESGDNSEEDGSKENYQGTDIEVYQGSI